MTTKHDYGIKVVSGTVWRRRKTGEFVTLLLTPMNENTNTRYAVYRRHSDHRLMTSIKVKFEIAYERVEE